MSKEEVDNGLKGEIQEEKIVVNANPENKRKQVKRNYSYKEKLGDERKKGKFDRVVIGDEEDPKAIIYVIPATFGSTYWAILKVMYQKVNQPVYVKELLAGIDSVMTEHDSYMEKDSWKAYCNKDQTKVHRKQLQQSHHQKAKSWEDRIIGNAKTLTRKDDYGKRLVELGHCLEFKRDESGKEYFILITSRPND